MKRRASHNAREGAKSRAVLRRERSRTGWRRLPVTLAAAVALASFVASPAYAAAPSNDDILDAVVVTGVPFTDTVDTSEATYGEGDSGCGLATVWYTYVPDTDGSIAFDTFGSDYDTTLAAFEGSPGDLTLLECNDDTISAQSRIALEVTAGVTYYLEAGTCCGAGEPGQVGPGGSLVFNVSVAPPPLTVEVAVSDRARIGRIPGTAIVGGTVTCNREAEVYIYGNLRQQQGLWVAGGDIYAFTECSTTPTRWIATVDAFPRSFRPGPATLSVTAFGCDEFTCAEDSAGRTVQIVNPRPRAVPTGT